MEIRPRDDRPYRSFEVRNPIHGTRYRVLAPGPRGEEVLLCPCPDFGRRDVGTCKHVEAVRAELSRAPSEPERPRSSPPVGELWERIEAALRAEPPRPWTDLRPRAATARRLIDR